MVKVQIKQNDGEPTCKVIIDGKDVSKGITSIQFPNGIRCAEYTPIILTALGEIDIDLESSDIKVVKNANISS